MTPAERWRRQLEAWAVPQALLDAAPVSPHGFDVAPFAGAADEAIRAPTPSHLAARAALPANGSVLDVGCGAGAASLPLAPPARRLIGVDEHPGMLEAFAGRAAARGAAHAEVLGRWPEVHDDVPTADVVVCHHVFYNVADLGAFVAALAAHARQRVVVELTATHPLAWMNELWRTLHGIERPRGPTADDAVAVLEQCEVHPQVVRWTGPFRLARASPEDVCAFARRRLCLDAAHDPALRAALRAHPPPPTRQLVTLSWSPAGTR